MKKLIGFILAFGVVIYALNFSGHQSLNGLGEVRIFTAPASGYYFVNGQLTLPMATSGLSGSQVIATVSRTGVGVIYSGPTGATGFQVGHIPLVTGDSVSVRLRSSIPVDQQLNAVRGEVYYGNGL